MTTQTPSTEERLSRLEGAYEQVSERLGDLSRGQDNLRSDINALREEVQRGQESLREEMQRGQESLRADIRSFRGNMLLLIGGVWATVVGGLIALVTLL